VKTIINSCKRTHGLKVSMALITCLLFLIFTSCQKDEFNQDSISDISPLASSKKPTATVGKVKDVDGNWYKTVKIGEQWWMAENLKTTRFNDRTYIPLVTENSIWETLTTPGYCWFNNDEATYKATYGAMYNWFSLNATSNGGKNVCPTGWHVPTDAEWTTLTSYLGGEEVAGGKLKETGTTHWFSPNTGATNETGFTALPSGLRGYDGVCYALGSYGYLWSSSESSATYGFYRYLVFNYSNLFGNPNFKQNGFAVRCLKD